MMDENNQKITTSHLKRNAYLYIRQSSLKQVMQNTESTQRQYALSQKAITLGWPLEQIITIDTDQGQSGATAVGREGFQYLVSEVGMGKAGMVIGIEVSRLARNSSDWHRLLEICALTETLILDEDGLYDPCRFNDRLLLGLKGTMSEAELHVLRARLDGGKRNKAKRGELKSPLPIGLVYNTADKVVFDPDQQVQESIRLFFKIFHRTGSASATVIYFRNKGIKFPHKIRKPPNKGEIVWGHLYHSKALRILHNPKYAGAYVFGQYKTRRRADGSVKIEKQTHDQWHTLIKNAYEGYISWKTYEENLKRLEENAQAYGKDRRKSPPREGIALLQGMVVCGICGNRMTIRYYQRSKKMIPYYMCQSERIEHGKPICQCINGESIDEAISELMLESMTPLTLEVALTVQKELEHRAEQIINLRKQEVERARYEADMARRRYMLVDPENRLVAGSLEVEWNQKLIVFEKTQTEYGEKLKVDHYALSQQEKEQIMSLVTNFPEIWNNPKTPIREKKRMLRLLIEDVTLIRSDHVTLKVRFRGGAIKTLKTPLPKNAAELRKSAPLIVTEIDRLLDQYYDDEIAQILNDRGIKTGTGQKHTLKSVSYIRRTYKLKCRYERLRNRGLLNQSEISKILQVSETTCKIWARLKILKSYRYNARGERLFDIPDMDIIDRLKQGPQTGRRQISIKLISNRLNEV
ncbi:recombinase family protein [Desulfobacula sp.]|uniref:recombinase family protein n=1 Tax=Desulfobacula sp. TaxID=2593537 RepID=UPI001EC2041D|nr:recombinase family protein [Desulfobacula sp.]